MVVSEKDERVMVSIALRELDASESEAAHDNPAAVRGTALAPVTGSIASTLLLRSLKCLCVIPLHIMNY